MKTKTIIGISAAIIIILIISLILFLNKTPIYPETKEIPILKLKWDYKLDENTVKGAGAFGVTENLQRQELATELEIVTKNYHDPIYAMADGIVVEIQKSENPSEEKEVEGVWIKYGKNAVIKYVHVYNPIVKEKDIIKTGDKIGYTLKTENNNGFFEVELRILENKKVYAVPFYDYCDNECKSTLLPLFKNPKINSWQTQNRNTPWKVMEKIDVTDLDNNF